MLLPGAAPSNFCSSSCHMLPSSLEGAVSYSDVTPLHSIRGLPNLLDEPDRVPEQPSVPALVALLRSSDETERDDALASLAEMVDGAFGEVWRPTATDFVATAAYRLPHATALGRYRRHRRRHPLVLAWPQTFVASLARASLARARRPAPRTAPRSAWPCAPTAASPSSRGCSPTRRPRCSK